MPHVPILESFRATIAGRAPELQVSGGADWFASAAGTHRGIARPALGSVPDGEVQHGECALVVPVRLRGNDFRCRAQAPMDQPFRRN